MIRVIFNQKGGVGKSSIATNLAAISAEYGFRTLVVDLDEQCNTSQYLLGAAFESVRTTIADYLAQCLGFRLMSRPAAEYVQSSAYPNLHLVAASRDLGELQHKLEAKHKIFKLKEFFDELAPHYEAIYVDTPPAFGFYTLSALIAANSCLVPFDCDDFSRRALYTLMENVAETRADHNRRLKVEGIIVNQFRANANFPQQIVDELRAEGLPMLETMLSSSVKMRESHAAGVPLVHFAPGHKLTQEFMTLFEELERDRLEFEGEVKATRSA